MQNDGNVIRYEKSIIYKNNVVSFKISFVKKHI